MLSHDHVNFLKDKDYFLKKQETDDQLNALMYSTQQALIENWNSSDQWFLPDEVSKIPGKISKGLNYKGFPYQVFDFPSIFIKEDIFTFRVIVWYGNLISINLILTGKYVEQYESRIKEFSGNSTNLLLSQNIWETDTSREKHIEISEKTADEVRLYFHRNKSIKLFRLFDMNQINEINRFTVVCFNDWFSK